MADLPELFSTPVVRSGGTKAKLLKVDEPYLHPHPKTGVLYYRREYPARLRPHIPGSPRELKVSLGAKSVVAPGVAEQFWKAADEYKAAYARAVKVKEGAYDRLAAHDIAYLAEVYRSETLGDDDTARWDPEERELYQAAAAQLSAAGVAYTTPWAGREGQRWALKTRATTGDVLAELKALRSNGDLPGIVGWWREEAVSLAEAKGYVLDASDAESLSALCRALNDAALSAGKTKIVRLDGDEYPPTPPEPIAPHAAPTRTAQASAKTFREIVQDVLDDPLYEITAPTRAQVGTALRYLTDVLGDLRPEEITRAEVTRWLKVVAQRPAFVTAKERLMPLGDIVARYAGQDVKRATQGTLKKHCGVLATRWSHAAKDTGAIPQALDNPFAGRSFGRSNAGPKEIDGFSPAELRQIFSLPFFTGMPQPKWGKGEGAYWLPHLAIYTGARPEEFAQLVLSDIYEDQVTGRHVFDFAGEGDHPEKGKQRLKTKEKGTGPRAFPIPSGLLSLGFLDYVEWLRAQGEEALFPHLRVRNKFGRLYPSFGEKWCEELYSKGILKRRTGRKPMREFRDTFTTGARISRIPEEAIGWLIGHTTAGANQPRMTRKYGKLSPYAERIDDYRPVIDVLELVRPWTPPAA